MVRTRKDEASARSQPEAAFRLSVVSLVGSPLWVVWWTGAYLPLPAAGIAPNWRKPWSPTKSARSTVRLN